MASGIEMGFSKEGWGTLVEHFPELALEGCEL
jgi:hypothetical protein